jgi:hypothetical protein
MLSAFDKRSERNSIVIAGNGVWRDAQRKAKWLRAFAQSRLSEGLDEAATRSKSPEPELV